MHTFVSGLVLGLGAVFLLAGALKWLDPSGTVSVVRALVPERLWQLGPITPLRLVKVLAVVEISVGLTLWLGGGFIAVALASAALLISGFLVVTIAASKRRLPCGCFGSSSARETQAIDVVRTSLLLIIAGIGFVYWYQAPQAGGLSFDGPSLLTGGATLLGVIALSAAPGIVRSLAEQRKVLELIRVSDSKAGARDVDGDRSRRVFLKRLGMLSGAVMSGLIGHPGPALAAVLEGNPTDASDNPLARLRRANPLTPSDLTAALEQARVNSTFNKIYRFCEERESVLDWEAAQGRRFATPDDSSGTDPGYSIIRIPYASRAGMVVWYPDHPQIGPRAVATEPDMNLVPLAFATSEAFVDEIPADVTLRFRLIRDEMDRVSRFSDTVRHLFTTLPGFNIPDCGHCFPCGDCGADCFLMMATCCMSCWWCAPPPCAEGCVVLQLDCCIACALGCMCGCTGHC